MMGSFLTTSKSEPDWKSEAQFAMESSCFCVICGSPFSLQGEVYSLDTEAERYKWMRSHRIIGSKHDIHYHNLAGLSPEDFYSACYNTSASSDVFLSARATWDEYNDSLFHIDGLDPDTNIPYIVTFNAMQRLQNYDTVFPLHEGCLQISRRAIDHLKPVAPDGHTPSSLSILNTILQSRFRRNAQRAEPDNLVARNDLFDLCTVTDWAGPRSVVGLSLLEWWAGEYEKFYTDPLNVDNVTACVLDLLHDTSAPKTRNASFDQVYQGIAKIERLPTELLGQICVYLPPLSALALYRTSRTMAIKLPLDNNFWRTTIVNRVALPYLWDLDVEELEQKHRDHSATPWDWKSIGQLLAEKQFPLKSSDLRINKIPNNLWNRRRIWSIIEEAYVYDLGHHATEHRHSTDVERRKKCEPVFDWQVEEIMEDLGHYS